MFLAYVVLLKSAVTKSAVTKSAVTRSGVTKSHEMFLAIVLFLLRYCGPGCAG